MMSLVKAGALELRAKLLIDGVHHLSDTELLALFIGCKNEKESTIPMQSAFNLLGRLGNLRAVLNAPLNTYEELSHSGMLYYAQMQAAKELCRRSDLIHLQKSEQLNNTHETYVYLKKRLRDYKNETFAALFLDNQHRIIAYEELFSGTINSAYVYLRPLVERVLELNAAAMILAHNHPSGLADPSPQDIALTARIRKALELVDTRLIDHLIVGDNEVYSIETAHKWLCHS